MGCAQSTVKDRVQDTTEAVPAAPVSEVAPTTTEAEAAAAPVETLAEEVAVAPVEEGAAPVEEAAPVATEAEPAAVAPVEEAAAAPVEEVAAPVEEEAVAAPVEEVAAAPEVVAEEPAVVEAEVAVVAEVAAEAEPETAVAPVVDETKQSGLVFVSAGVTFGDKGVAYYNYNGSNAEDPALDVKVSKRFNDFKALHAEIATIMANESNVAPEHQDKFTTYPALPALPKTSLFRGRSNQKQTEDREAQFLKILNAVAKHPIAAESPKFKAFLA
jgi:hypothetical protein